MGITYKIDAEAEVIFTVAEGEIGAVDIVIHMIRYTTDPLYNPNLAQLFDARSAQISFSGGEAWSLATWSRKNRPTAKTAIVIDEQAQGYARKYLGWARETEKLFYDMASAREWLGLPPEEG